MSDRKCLCNHWANKEHEINLRQSGVVRPKCTLCNCKGVILP